MKTLLILRHGKSSWDDNSIPDHDRPLNDRGLRDAPRVGVMLKEEALLPDVILSSTALRAKDTAHLVAQQCGLTKAIKLIPDFYPGTPTDYINTLKKLDDKIMRVMVVGHNPGLEELFATLTGARQVLDTATLAHLEIPIKKWKDLSIKIKAKPIQIWRPKENF